MKTQIKKQSYRSSRIAESWAQGRQPAPENNIVDKSKEAMAGLPKMHELRNELVQQSGSEQSLTENKTSRTLFVLYYQPS
jgi:hypothetical protein